MCLTFNNDKTPDRGHCFSRQNVEGGWEKRQQFCPMIPFLVRFVLLLCMLISFYHDLQCPGPIKMPITAFWSLPANIRTSSIIVTNLYQLFIKWCQLASCVKSFSLRKWTPSLFSTHPISVYGKPLKREEGELHLNVQWWRGRGGGRGGNVARTNWLGYLITVFIIISRIRGNEVGLWG